jgi:uridine kinase
MTIKITEPNKEVEVHLADGRTLRGPRGASVEDFMKALNITPNAPIVAAIVNGSLREMHYKINTESTIKPITTATADGARIYRRSLTFLLEFAFQQLFPKGILTIDHSVGSGGYYCQVAGRDQLSNDELKTLRKRMQAEITRDAPFLREEVPLEVAIQHFEKLGHEDKIALFSHRKKII